MSPILKIYPHTNRYCLSIVFRAFQGIGAAGVYSSCLIVLFEMFTPEKIPMVAAGISVVLALSTVLGPMFGGAITQTGSWRWVFLFK
jgi:MFS family permease